MIEWYTLLTNLMFVGVNGVRTFTNALLLCDSASVFNPRHRRFQLCGFGPDPAWLTFDVDVPSLAYTSERGESPHVFIGGDGTPRPLVSGRVLTFEGGPVLTLATSKRDADVCVDCFEGTEKDQPICRVWEVLPRRVAEYWDRPNMPSLTWGPPAWRQ